MRLRFVLFLGMCFSLNTCKTSSSDPSGTKEVSAESAELDAAIVTTVIKFYSDVKSHPDVIKQFATALQEDPYVAALPTNDLQRLYETRSQSEGGKDSKFERYVAHEFIALTNYIAWKILPGQTLMYLGSAVNFK